MFVWKEMTPFILDISPLCAPPRTYTCLRSIRFEFILCCLFSSLAYLPFCVFAGAWRKTIFAFHLTAQRTFVVVIVDVDVDEKANITKTKVPDCITQCMLAKESRRTAREKSKRKKKIESKNQMAYFLFSIQCWMFSFIQFFDSHKAHSMWVLNAGLGLFDGWLKTERRAWLCTEQRFEIKREKKSQEFN